MSESGARARVGVRELRQNLSVYLRRVEEGEGMDVTEHGRLVARLEPALPEQASALTRLIAEKRATPARRSAAEIPEPIQLPAGATPPSQILGQMRAEDRG
jgi:prevent-host-death family protein